jgi:Cell division septal protein
MNKIGIKFLFIGFILFGLLGFFGAENVIKWRAKKLSIKSISHPIKYVRIEGVFQYLSKNEVQSVVQPLVMTSFFEVDIQEIQSAVITLPWVDSISVKRIWPDAIDIKVYERKPFARWSENSLVTEQGVVFKPDNIDAFKQLTLVNGPEQQQVKVLEIMKGIEIALADQSMVLTEFSINNRGAWK